VLVGVGVGLGVAVGLGVGVGLGFGVGVGVGVGVAPDEHAPTSDQSAGTLTGSQPGKEVWD